MREKFHTNHFSSNMLLGEKLRTYFYTGLPTADKIEIKIHTEPLIQYVFSNIKYLITSPFLGSADCLL